jgi:predicted dienelactone hydrolase
VSLRLASRLAGKLLLVLASLRATPVLAAGVVGSGTPESCTEAALDAALAGGGVVTFDCGAEPVTITVTSTKVIVQDTTIDGGGFITISGGDAVGVLDVPKDATLELRSLTIADGRREAGSYDGGAVRNEGIVTVHNCGFVRNYAGWGGAISNLGTLTIAGCVFSENRAAGGSITSSSGGAIVNFGTVTVSSSTFSANSAEYGGAIHNVIEPATITVSNCTLSGNSARFGGDAIGNGGSVTLMNTIINEINGPSESNCDNYTPVTDGGHNLQWPGMSCGTTIPSRDPLLDPNGLQDNGGPTQTIALLPGSPAINAGDPEVCADPPVNGLDQRGYVRPGRGSANCSIGAYEYNSPGPPMGCAGDCDGDGEVTIEELIILVNIALGNAAVTACTAGDTDGDGTIAIDEIIRAVNAALSGCPPLPWQPGPFGVGYRRLTLTKESVTVPGQQRALGTWIWYPADPVTASLKRRPAGSPNVPFMPGLTQVPLLVFSHGSCGLNTASLFLTTVLASHGFVVAAPSHPGNVLGEPTCATAEAKEDSYANRPADISFVIDSLLVESETPGAFFHDTIDAARIGVMGHSFGGVTTLLVSALDERVIAGLALAPGISGIPSRPEEIPIDEIPRIRIPMIIQGGGLDTLAPFETLARRAYELLGPPRYLVNILGIGHFGFSNECVAPFDPCGQPGTLTQDEAHRVVLRYAVPFFLRWVAGEHRFDVYLSPAPGVVFTADTGAR